MRLGCTCLAFVADGAPRPPETGGWADAETLFEMAGQAMTAAVREADDQFQTVGGSSRHWVRDCFIPALAKAGLGIVPLDELNRLQKAVQRAPPPDPAPAAASAGYVYPCDAILRLLKEGVGPGGGYYEPEQRVAAAVSLLECGWGLRAASAGEGVLREELERLKEAIGSAPHAPFCLSYTIIEGQYPTYRSAPPQIFRPREPPDEALCNCWKRAALAPAQREGKP